MFSLRLLVMFIFLLAVTVTLNAQSSKNKGNTKPGSVGAIAVYPDEKSEVKPKEKSSPPPTEYTVYKDEYFGFDTQELFLIVTISCSPCHQMMIEIAELKKQGWKGKATIYYMDDYVSDDQKEIKWLKKSGLYEFVQLDSDGDLVHQDFPSWLPEDYRFGTPVGRIDGQMFRGWVHANVTFPEEKLTVNKSKEHYRSIRNRALGEKELQKLAQTSDIEEAWVYIEGNDTKGNKVTLWYEIGENDSSFFTTIDHKLIAKTIKDSHLTNIVISVYHIHPKNHDLSQGVTATETPSPEDIKSLFFSTQLLANEENYYGPFDFRIVTPTGIYIVKHSTEVLKLDKNIWIRLEAALYNAWEKARDELFHTGQYQRAQGPNEIARINDSVAQAMTKEPHFIVTFQKFSE